MLKEQDDIDVNENEDSFEEEVPEVDQELSKVASDPKKSIAILVVLVIGFIYFMYSSFFSETEVEKAMREKERDIATPANVVKPTDVSALSNIPSLPSLPSPGQLEDPNSNPVLIANQENPAASFEQNLPELPTDAEVLPNAAVLPEATEPEPELPVETPPAPEPQPSNPVNLPPSSTPLSSFDLQLPDAPKIRDPEAEKRRRARLKSSIILIAGVRPQKTAEQLKQEANFKKRGDMNRMLGRGKLIDAVVENAINTDFGGEIRAVINRDIYSEWGRNILIPKGSRIFGNYSTGFTAGYGRIQIVWNRIDLPTGYSLTFSGAGIDDLGRKGNQGRVDNKFKERFANAVLKSALNIAIASALDDLMPIKTERRESNKEFLAAQNASNVGNIIFSKTITPTYTAQNQATEACTQLRLNITDKSSSLFNQIDSACNTILAKPTIAAADVTSLKNILTLATNNAAITQELDSIETRTEKAANSAADNIADTTQQILEEQDYTPTATIDQGTVLKVYVNQDYIFPKDAIIGSNSKVMK